MRRPWRVLAWSLCLYAVLYLAMNACAGWFGGPSALGCAVALPPIVGPITVVGVLGRLMWSDRDVAYGVDRSFVVGLLMFGSYAVVIAEFVAQTMLAAALIDSVARRLRRRPLTAEPLQPRE